MRDQVAEKLRAAGSEEAIQVLAMRAAVTVFEEHAEQMASNASTIAAKRGNAGRYVSVGQRAAA